MELPTVPGGTSVSRTLGAADMVAKTQEKTPTMPPRLNGWGGVLNGGGEVYAALLGPIRGKGGA